MPESVDPYLHHPELVGKITDSHSSFFRNFRPERVLESHPELEWVLEKLHTDEQREESRTQFLDAHPEQDLWVFAYGSLMWDPALQFAEVRRASVAGYARQFILKDVLGARGTVEAPGLMAALDRGDHCDGLVFRVAAKDIDEETEILWRREMVAPGYIPTMVDTAFEGQEVKALTFVADHDAEIIASDLTLDEQIEFIATGSGFLGTSKEYLENIVSQFNALDIVDERCEHLLGLVEDYKAKA